MFQWIHESIISTCRGCRVIKKSFRHFFLDSRCPECSIFVCFPRPLFYSFFFQFRLLCLPLLFIWWGEVDVAVRRKQENWFTGLKIMFMLVLDPRSVFVGAVGGKCLKKGERVRKHNNLVFRQSGRLRSFYVAPLDVIIIILIDNLPFWNYYHYLHCFWVAICLRGAKRKTNKPTNNSVLMQESWCVVFHLKTKDMRPHILT